MKSGFICINKDINITTNYINNYLKKKFNLKKIGHLGTLDPFATGLVILAINEATKFLNLVDDKYKSYRAKLLLGISTSTYDLTGLVIDSVKVKKYKEKEITEILNSFIGKYFQLPPKYSAKRVNGKRAYYLARNNIDFNLEKKEVEIKDIKLVSYDKENNIIDFTVEVSKGTYIRSLAIDIANKLNTIGHLIYLDRLSIGKINKSNSIKKEEVNEDNIIPINKFLNINSLEIDDLLFQKVSNGNTISLKIKDKYIFLTYKNSLVALYYKNDNIYKCYRKINSDESI